MRPEIESTEGIDMPMAPAKAREEGSAAQPAIGPDATMADILHAYPTAKIALFIRYHIGGCTSCSYQLTDTLAEVHQNYNIKDSLEALLAAVRQSASVEAKIHISQQELASALQRGEGLRLLDTRSTSEWQAGHLVGARPVTVELTFNGSIPGLRRPRSFSTPTRDGGASTKQPTSRPTVLRTLAASTVESRTGQAGLNHP